MTANLSTIDKAIARTEQRIRLLKMTPVDRHRNPKIDLTREKTALENLKHIRSRTCQH